MTQLNRPYRARRRHWNVEELKALIPGSAGDLGERVESVDRARLWTDLVAEYDARFLQRELMRRASGRYSHEFLAFIEAWALDEEKHADGLCHVYCAVCGEDAGSVQSRLKSRQPDFASFSSILDDEFRLAVLFAYDEAMSTRGYGEDIPFYASLGPPAIEALLRHLRADEAIHYANAVDLLAYRHRHRAEDVRAAMDEIVELDAHQDAYQGTFVLDHATDQFSRTTMRTVGDKVAAVIERRLTAR